LSRHEGAASTRHSEVVIMGATSLPTSSDNTAQRWCLIAVLALLLWPMTATAQSEDLVALMRRITELSRAGRYAEAIPHAQRLVAEAERTAGKDHQLTAMTLFTLADLHRMQGQFYEAEPMLNRVLAIREHTLGASHPDVATTLATLAQLCLSMARYAEAEDYLSRTLDIRTRTLGREHPDIGMTLITIARLRHQQGRLDEAEAKNRDALGLFEKALGPDHMYVSVALNNLAELHKAQGRLGEVEADLLRALQILERQFGPDSHAIAPMLNNLGELRRLEGRYAEAEAFYRREFEISERALGPEHPELATTLGNLGTLFVRQGRAEDAESLLRRALAIREKALGAEHPDVAVALNNLADALDQLDRPAEAEPLLRRSLAVREKNSGPDHASVAAALDNLATHFHKQMRFAEAVPLATRSLAIRERTLGVEHPFVANSLNNLAAILDMLDRHDEAAPLLQRALSMREKIYGTDHPQVAISLHNLASNYLDQEQWESAYRLFKRASEIWVARQTSAAMRSGGRSEVSANADPFLGLIIAAYESRQAASSPRKVDLEAEAFAAAQWLTGSRAAAAISAMSARFATRSDDLGELVRKRQDLAEQALAVDRALLAAISQSSNDRNAPREAALRQQAADNLAKLREADATLARHFPGYAALMYPTPIPVSAIQGLLRPEEALLVFVPVRDATYIWLLTKTRYEWTRSPIASKVLKERIATLRCGLDATAWYGESGLRCASLLKVGLDSAPKQGDPLPFNAAMAAELYGLLLGPFAELIQGKHLLIAPSGSLTSLPFSVLLAEQPTAIAGDALDYRRLAWLGLRQPITVLPSVAALQALRRVAKQSSAKQLYLGVGNPLLEGQPDDPKHGEYFKRRAIEALDKQTCPKIDDLELGARVMSATPQPRGRFATFFRSAQVDIEQVREWAPLPETADELCEVGRRLGVPESEILLGGRATEAAIKSLSENGRLADYAILHFATHGALAGQGEALAEPGLVLTPPPKDTRDPDLLARDDGYLAASEIAALKLNADWVVLSACNTAGGTGETAEALSGLARAFFYAGARALLVSNWEVGSDAAVKLTTRAFAELKANPKIGRAEAFRLSMRDLVEKGSLAETHPAMWAPFVVVGEGAR
jgi:CHAT domain-containing protein/tetratricopeptide (TPR) repeat protein